MASDSDEDDSDAFVNPPPKRHNVKPSQTENGVFPLLEGKRVSLQVLISCNCKRPSDMSVKLSKACPLSLVRTGWNALTPVPPFSLSLRK